MSKSCWRARLLLAKIPRLPTFLPKMVARVEQFGIGRSGDCNLAYQFGQELRRVVANSWARDAKPGGPCQWLEEALVETFSFRGLGRLADSWRARPPFPNDNAYADAILKYRDRTLQPDWKLAQDQRTAARVEGVVQRASRVSGNARLGGYGSPCRPDDSGPL